MQEDKIKEAFEKVKSDIDFLYDQIQELKRTLDTINNQNKQNQTDNRHSTDTSTHNYTSEAVKSPNLLVSIGTEGVSTDRQTDRQPPYFHWKTEQNIPENYTENEEIISEKVQNHSETKKSQEIGISTHKKPFKRASELIGSLDEIRREIRLKFKKLTTQEMTVFSKLYELEEQGFIVDYTILSENLSLTESSIRDYIQRLIKKGIPVDKHKENNKKITLTISDELRKIASLNTIHQLRTL